MNPVMWLVGPLLILGGHFTSAVNNLCLFKQNFLLFFIAWKIYPALSRNQSVLIANNTDHARHISYQSSQLPFDRVPLFHRFRNECIKRLGKVLKGTQQ